MQTRNPSCLYNILLVIVCVIKFGTINAQLGSTCETPNKEIAKCINIRSCKVLFDSVFNPDVKFLQASQCGWEGSQPLVCCGSTHTYRPVTPTPKTDIRKHRNFVLLPNESFCGFQYPEDKIIGGNTTSIYEFPWMVLLKYRHPSGVEKFSCAGSLISDRYVLTAAHCIVGEIKKVAGILVSARLGEWNIDTEEDCFTANGVRICSDPPVNIEVEDAVAHSEYDENSGSRHHDIGLVRLKRSPRLSKFIQPVCISSTDATAQTDDLLQVVGWGKTDKGIFSPTKQKLTISVNSYERCRRKFTGTNVNIAYSQICAGGEAGKDSCKRDSGGPLLSKSNDAQFTVEGIVSFGFKCGEAGWPGIYTRVSEYRNWILDHMTP